MAKLLLWNDKETIDLNTKNPVVLEDYWELTDITANHSLFEQHDLYPANLKHLAPEGYVRDMHTSSGLVAELLAGQEQIEGDESSPYTTITEAQIRLLARLDNFVGKDDTLFLAGSGIARFDMTIIEVLMPELFKRFYYAPVDVGIARRMYSFTGSVVLGSGYPFVEPEHRAKDDVKQSQEIFRVLSRHMSHFEME